MKINKAKMLYYLTRKGMTLKEVSDVIGMSYSNLVNVANGRKTTKTSVYAIAKALDTEVEAINEIEQDLI